MNHGGFGAPQGRSYLRTGTGHQFELRPNRVYFIGRAEDCDLKTDDPGCSRRHAKLSVAGDVRVVHLEDLGSKNGTHRNDEQIKKRVQLSDGDYIRVGKTIYRIHLWQEGMSLDLDTRTVISETAFGSDKDE